MTTEHQDDQRRGGGFREAVNDLFGRNERDTSQLDALDRDEARRHGDVGAADPVAERDTARHAHGGLVAVTEPGQYGDSRVDDPAQQTTPGVRFDAGDPAAAGTADARTGAAGHGDPLADDVAGRQTTAGGRYDETAGDLGAQRTPPQGEAVTRDEHLGEARTPHGGEVRGDTVAPEHVRQGGDPTAQGQVQHGGELRGDPAGTRSDADLAAGAPTRDADAGATTAGVGAGTASSATAHHNGAADASDDGDRAALVTRDRADSYGARWDSVKGEFVDEPRRAVADADALVGELLDELQELFKQQRTQIEQGLDADETSTEDLRLALRRYRSFFDRLLSI